MLGSETRSSCIRVPGCPESQSRHPMRVRCLYFALRARRRATLWHSDMR